MNRTSLAWPSPVSGRRDVGKSEPGLKSSYSSLSVLDLGHVQHKVYEPVAVAPLVVVPRDNLDERGVEHDARLRVEHRGARVVHEVLANHLLKRQTHARTNAKGVRRSATFGGVYQWLL